jgi:hypothetical protein
MIEVHQLFSKFISEMSHGTVDGDLTEQLEHVTKACNETNLPGELSIKLTLKPTGEAVVVTCATTTKIPRHPVPGSTYFAGEAGTLHRENPRQRKLPLKEIARPEFKAIKGGDGNDEN